MNAGDDGAKSVIEFMQAHGPTVGGLALLLQIATQLRLADSVIISGQARLDTLAWLDEWEAQARL